MKRLDASIVLGLVLILAGGLYVLQDMGFLSNAGDLFWGALFLAVGVLFLYTFLSGSWWGAFPAFTLLGIGTLILLPPSLEAFGGAVFLGAVGLSFWAVYITGRAERWWALIPAGTLTTLAFVTFAPDLVGETATGGVFFLGLALTFLLVALLAKMRWAYYPAAALGVLGVLLMLSVGGVVNYIWAVVLILVGAYLVYRNFRTA